MIEVLTILVFAVVQSIFGIGLLFFGTPTLIVLGFSFPETLSVLLPASIAVSFLQVLQGGLPERRRIRNFALWCMLPLFIALVGSLGYGWDIELEIFIAAMLLAYVVIRISPRMADCLRAFVLRFPKAWLTLIGTVHGLSNLGGGLLGIYAANTFNEKREIRGHIAFCYLCFAVVQLATLAILTPAVMHFEQIGYAAIAGGVFAIFERRLFGSLTAPAFERLFTAMIGAYSALIFLKLAGAFSAETFA